MVAQVLRGRRMILKNFSRLLQHYEFLDGHSLQFIFENLKGRTITSKEDNNYNSEWKLQELPDKTQTVYLACFLIIMHKLEQKNCKYEHSVFLETKCIRLQLEEKMVYDGCAKTPLLRLARKYTVRNLYNYDTFVTLVLCLSIVWDFLRMIRSITL